MPGKASGVGPCSCSRVGVLSFGKKGVLGVAGAMTEWLERTSFRVGEALERAVTGSGTFIKGRENSLLCSHRLKMKPRPSLRTVQPGGSLV